MTEIGNQRKNKAGRGLWNLTLLSLRSPEKIQGAIQEAACMLQHIGM